MKKYHGIKLNWTGQVTLISIFLSIWITSIKPFFWKGEWVLGTALPHF